MPGPAIPYLTLPEIPLGFLTRLPDGVIGAIVGLVVAGALGGVLLPGSQEAPLRRRLVALFAVAGAVVGYLYAPHWLDPKHPPSIKPFGTLVALGVYLGSIVATRHAKERGLDLKKMGDFIFWVVGLGFVGGHVLDAIFYHPQTVAHDPLYLFKLWDGLSSYGGFTGAAIGVVAWRFSRRERVLPYVDTVASAYPLAWVFGRAGCTVAHDHPGRVSDAWYAVRYPLGDGIIGRYDLGLYELLLTIPLAIAFWILWRRGPRPYGFYTGLMCTAYAPVRFFLDFLRAPDDGGIVGADPRYAGLTPAQWASFGLLALGLYLLSVARRGPLPAGPHASKAGEPPASEEAAPTDPAERDEPASAR